MFPGFPGFPPNPRPRDPSYHTDLQPSKTSLKQKFSAEEDRFLTYLVSLHGSSNWKQIASQMHGRTVCQCRERWNYYLDSRTDHRPWTGQEDQLLLAKHQEMGPKWSQMTAFFHSRTGIDLKNRFHRIQRTAKRKERNAMDPPQFEGNGSVANGPVRSFLEVALCEGIQTKQSVQRKNETIANERIPKRIVCSRTGESTEMNELNPR
jgi:hypothetical protein